MNPLRRLALWVFNAVFLGLRALRVLGWALGSGARLEGQRVPVLVLEVRTCTDRCTTGLESLLPQLEREGCCNSSHGGSCCACGGRLPNTHEHVLSECGGCIGPWGELCSDAFGGIVCSAACRNRFVGWLEDTPPMRSICLGHGKPPSVFGSWGRHQRHSVEVRRVEKE